MIRRLILALFLLYESLFAVTNVNVPAGGNIATAVNGAVLGSPGDCSNAVRTVHNASICVLVADGNFVGPITLTKTGTATQRVVILSATKNGAKITNPELTYNASFVDWMDFDMTAPNDIFIQQMGPGASFNTFQYNYVHDVLTSSCHPNGVLNDIGSSASPASHNTYNANIVRHWGTTNTANCPPPQVSFHGIYADGAATVITNNVFSGGSGGWAIQKQYTVGASGATCAPGIIANNTVFNNQGGIVINERDGSGAPVSCTFAGWSVINNIIVLNGVAGTSAGTANYGIDFFRYNAGNAALFSNNMIWGNLPADIFNNTGNTPATLQNPKTDANTGVTFINFQSDTNASPAPSYSAANYKLKAGSAAIQGGTSACASGGITPCVPGNDFSGTTARPLSGPQDIGAWAVTSTGVPIVSFNPSPLNFGTVPVSTSSGAFTTTLTNTGAASLAISSKAISGTNQGDFSETDNCGGSLGAGLSCTFNVTFTPQAAGSRSASLTITDNASGSPHQVALLGAGGTPALTANPTALSFGVIAPGSTSPIQIYTLTNTGNVSITEGVTAIGGANPGDFAFGGTGSCNTNQVLVPGASCTISIVFKPTAVGSRSATVSTPSNGPTVVAGVSGTGGAPVVGISPASAACGSQQVLTSQTCQAFSLTNTGNLSLSGITVSITGANPTSFTQSNNCPSSLAAAANCAITVFFSPQVAGALSANLSIASNASTSPNAAALSGTGNPPASIALSPTTVNFGNVIVGATSAPSGITVTNTGGTAATISGVTTALPFAQSNNCPASLGPGASCIVSVTASPSATGIANGTVSVASSASGSPFVASLSVTGVAPAVSLTPASIAFGSQPVGSQTTAQAFTLLNNGTSALTFTIALAGTNPGDFVLSTGCVSPLQPNQNCLISTAFKPTTAGARSAIVRVTDNASGSPHSSTVTGTGVATSPAVCLSVPSINFGNQAVGTSSGSRPVVVTNCGTANLVVSGVTPTGNFSQTNNCGTVLPNAFCTINATFSPLSTGNLTGQLSIASNSASTPDLVALSGFGTTTGANLSPTTINFGSVTVGQPSTNQPVTLQNTGNTTLAVSQTTITGTNAADFVSGSCPPTLAPNASCIYFATFIPTGPGSRTATLTQPFGGGVPSQTIALSGTGVAAAPAVTLVPTSLDFGNVTTSATFAIKTVTVTNSGNAVLNSSSITVTGTNSADYAITNHCGLTLSAGANCTVDVTVTPSGTGARTANLHLVNDAASSPQNVPLTVNGVAAPAPRVSLSPTALSFSPPSIQTGTTSGAQTLTVVNIGNANLTVTHPVALGGSNPGDFTISDNCGTVAPGLSCTATVNCKPTAAGARTATVIFTSNASTSPDTATASCTGFVGTPNLVLAVSTINFGNTTVGTVSAQLVFTITNNGLATASGVVISAVGDFGVTDTCGGTIPQGTGCTASVTFSPQILCGQIDPNTQACISNVHTGQVSVVSNTANSPQTISLQGTAIPVPPPPGPIKVTMGGKLVIGGRVVMGVQ